MDLEVIRPPRVFCIPVYLQDRVKEDPDRNKEKMSPLDLKDFIFFNDIFLNTILGKSLGITYFPTNARINFVQFSNSLQTVVDERLSKVEDFNNKVPFEVCNVNEFLQTLYVNPPHVKEDGKTSAYEELENINMNTINTDSIGDFVTYKITNVNDIIIILQDNFFNLCVMNPSKAFSVFLERLFNLIVKNYGEACIRKSEQLSFLRNAYINLLYTRNTI